MILLSLTWSQTFWSAKSSGPYKAPLWTKLVKVMEFQLSYFKSWKTMPWKWCTQYASNLENSAVATVLKKGSFHSNPKERQCQRMLRLPRNCTHLAQRVKRLPAMRETWIRSLGRKDPLEKELATHSSILAWRTPQMEEPGRLQSTGSHRVGHDWSDLAEVVP